MWPLMPFAPNQARMGAGSPIYAIMREMKGALALLFAVGFIVNLLQLTGSVYMMQVYDRVLSSQSEATLLALTLISLFLIAIYGILEGCRSFALIGLGRLIDRRLSSRVFEALFVLGSLRGSDFPGFALRPFFDRLTQFHIAGGDGPEAGTGFNGAAAKQDVFPFRDHAAHHHFRVFIGDMPAIRAHQTFSVVAFGYLADEAGVFRQGIRGSCSLYSNTTPRMRPKNARIFIRLG